MQTQVAKRLPRVLTVSESSKRDIVSDHGVPPERIQVVPVGVDPALFAPRPEVARMPGRLITTASADVTMKGLSFLLEAVAKLRTERHVELTIIGRAKSDSAASRAISELGLADAITFVSGVSDDRIVELYAEAELAVVPSLYEGFSLPAIEAMSCGVPLVATTGGALPEVAGTPRRNLFLDRARRRRGACRGAAGRSGRSRGPGPGGRGRAPAGHQPVVLAPHRGADRGAVPRRAGGCGEIRSWIRRDGRRGRG